MVHITVSRVALLRPALVGCRLIKPSAVLVRGVGLWVELGLIKSGAVLVIGLLTGFGLVKLGAVLVADE